MGQALAVEMTWYEEIIAEMKELYLRDTRPWILMFSTGKDSSLMLTLLWQMLLSLSPEQWHKKVHVITTDTKVETPSMTRFVLQSVQAIRETVQETGLPIEMHLGRPEIKDSFFFQVIGKGNPVPTRDSRFRYCTDKMKIKPADTIVETIVATSPPSISFSMWGDDEYDKYDVVMLLGVREEESVQRRNSMRKFALHEKFARHAKHKRVLGYHPIKYVGVDELWTYLLDQRKLPWGIKSSALYAMYKDSSGECPMTEVAGTQNNSCGGSRFGCWVCCYVKRDKMMENLIESGETELIPMLEFKEMLRSMRNDIRYRQPLRRQVLKGWQKPARTQDLFESTDEYAYDTFKRADNWTFEPGPMAVAGRVILLQKLLFVQQVSGEELIEEEELLAILEAWRQDGYEVTEKDVVPIDHHYDGPLVLNPDATTNKSATKNPYPVFAVWEDFDSGVDESAEFIHARAMKTGRNFFYFMNCVDYARDFRMSITDPVVNQIQFIVCEAGITTQEQAEALIYDWLFKREEEVVDWHRIGRNLQAQATELLEDPSVDSERIDRINQTLISIGMEPVSLSVVIAEIA